MKDYMAPMEGLTTYIFRNAFHQYYGGIDKYFTPFLCNRHMSSREKNDILPEHNSGMCTIPQILTNKAEDFLSLCQDLSSYGYDTVNLNLGCPSGTVVAKGRGAGFLSCPDELDAFLDEIFNRCPLSISIKTRIGMEQESEWETLLSLYQKYPIAELIIHPRVREDYYKGSVRMEAFEEGIAMSKSPVCYNGDIFTVSQEKVLEEKFPQLNRVMIGRGVCANPGLVSALKTGNPVTLEQFMTFHDCLYKGYQDFFLAMSGQRVVLFKMKEIWCYMASMFADCKKQEKKIKKAQSLADYEAAVAAMVRECQFQPDHGFLPPR